MRHTVEEKLRAIGMVQSGKTPRSVSRELHLGHHSLYEWLKAYEEKGIPGLENKTGIRKKRLTFEEKREIVLECENSDLPLYQISVKHGIAESTLREWSAKAARHGMDSLAGNKSVTTKSDTVRMKRIPKEECERENERLRKENERLKVEILLLKKVKALVEEREARNRRIGRVPSKG